MTVHPGYDNPQLTCTTGPRHGRHLDCSICGAPIDTAAEHWTLWTGTPARPDLHAVAHFDFDDGLDGGGCYGLIRQRWLALAETAGAGLIERHDPNGYWTVHGDDLHCGTPTQILTGDGTWLSGRYEIASGPRGQSPVVYIPLGGINQPQAGVPIDRLALIRLQPVSGR